MPSSSVRRSRCKALGSYTGLRLCLVGALFKKTNDYMKRILLATMIAAASLTGLAQTTEAVYLFDFGGAGSPGSRGEITTEPGWNNICPSGISDQSMAQFSAFSNLVDSKDNPAPADMKLTLTTAWGVNEAGGLSWPAGGLSRTGVCLQSAYL